MVRKTLVTLDRAYVEHLLNTELLFLDALKGPTVKGQTCRNMRRATRLRIQDLTTSLMCYQDPVLVRIGFQKCFDYMRSAAVRIRGHKHLIDKGIGDPKDLREIKFYTTNAQAIAAGLRENTSVPKYVQKVSFDTVKNPLEGIWFDES